MNPLDVGYSAHYWREDIRIGWSIETRSLMQFRNFRRNVASLLRNEVML